MLPGLSPKEQELLLTSVGSHRKIRAAMPVKVAELFDKAIKHGATKRDCANFVHFDDTGMVSRFLKLLVLVPDIKLLVDWGKSGTTIGFTTAVEIGRLDKEIQPLIAKLLLKHQLISKEVRMVIRLYFQNKNNFETCVEQVLRLRPTITTRQVYIGAILSSKLSDSLREMTQDDRNDLFKTVLKRYLPNIQNCGNRLSEERFLVVGGKIVSKELDSLEGGFEKFINDLLKKIVFESE